MMNINFLGGESRRFLVPHLVPHLVLLCFAALSLWSGPALAIETSASVRGVVVDGSGNPLPGATVTIVRKGTAVSKSVRAAASGEFSFRNLPVGSGYSITVTSSGYGERTISDLTLLLGQTTDLDIALAPDVAMEEVVVTGARLKSQVAIGPAASFGLRELERSPAINRNITDVIRIDPRIYVDESRGEINAIQCGGKNSRFNSLVVDGVPVNDLFGLNSNGYPTERIPFSYDAVEQTAVEFAPFDASYGRFTACNINAVSKSGSNQFTGSFFYDYTDNDFRSDSLEGDDINTGDYDETRWGVTLGGPVVSDRLYFFAAYEKLDGANLFDRGTLGSGAVNEVQVTQEEIDEIVRIARELYQYDPGPVPNSLDNEDEKFLVKLDWYMTDTQRLAFTYTHNDGFNMVQSDSDLDEFEFQNHLYERGAEFNSYVATLYSDWTDNFSTQVRIGTTELENRQLSVGGTDFGEIRVELPDVDVYLGGDDSRQANQLSYETNTYVISGNYELANHSLSFGIEREELEIFNLFVQHTETEIRFRGIDNFRNGLARAIYYNNAPSNNPSDAAADWTYAVNTVYFQDEFEPVDGLLVTAGLRYDRYKSGDRPLENPEFVASYGFSNATNLNGEGLLQPRLGFTWRFSDAMTITGGVGRYAGGDPNVWLSNNFSANNVLQFGQRGRSFGYTDGSRSLFDPDVVYEAVEPGLPSGPGYGIPKELYDAVAGGVGDNFELNYLDPGFNIPSEWKFAIGFAYDFQSGLRLQADTLWTRGRDSAIVRRGDLERTGTNDDGYPIYASVRVPSFLLTNSSRGNRSFGLSVNLSQSHDNGMDWTLGYAYNDAEDVSPMTSSVAFSNYQNRAFFDPQEDKLATSNYNIRHRITGTWVWEAQFFGDNSTIFSVYGSANEGPPFSRTVPGNPIYTFTPFLEGENVLPPGGKRNDEDGSWWFKMDFKVEQQFAVGPGDASVFVVIDNLTNLLNDDWGILEEVDFPNTVGPGDQDESRIGDASRYEIRLGVEYSF